MFVNVCVRKRKGCFFSGKVNQVEALSLCTRNEVYKLLIAKRNLILFLVVM